MNRKLTNSLRSIIDNSLPAVLREGWPFHILAKLWLGGQSMVNFKEKAFQMSDQEYIDAYRVVGGLYGKRGSDTTENQASWLLQHLEKHDSILEIGPGDGRVTRLLIRKGCTVTTCDLFPPRGDSSAVTNSVVGVAERLPFRNRAFDVVVLAHVLEHVRQLTVTLLELERICRNMVLIITPRQRFYRVTFDYHLHFFYSLDHLKSFIPSGRAEGEIIDGDLCLIWTPALEHRS